MCGLSDPGELAVELGHPTGATVLAGGIHRVEVPAGTMYLFATTLGLEHAQAVAASDEFEVSAETAEQLAVGFIHDGATAITLAQILAPAGGDGGPQLEAIQHVLVRCAAGDCRRARGHARLRELAECTPGSSTVPCQGVCAAPMAGLERDGVVRWYGKMRGDCRRSLARVLATGRRRPVPPG